MNSGLVEFFHGIQVAVMLALMLNIVQFAWWTVKRDKTKKSHCTRYGPVYLVLFSSLLVMIQPVSMLVIGSWKSIDNFFFDGGDFKKLCTANADCGSKMCLTNAFNCTGVTIAPDVLLNGACTQLSADAPGVNCTRADVMCSCGMDSSALLPNTTVGWMIQVFGTYLGFIIMFVGVTMATKLHKKIARKWRALRGVRRAPQTKASNYPRAQTSSPPAAAEEEDCKT